MRRTFSCKISRDETVKLDPAVATDRVSCFYQHIAPFECGFRRRCNTDRYTNRDLISTVSTTYPAKYGLDKKQIVLLESSALLRQ